jgi:hypothetical protein
MRTTLLALATLAGLAAGCRTWSTPGQYAWTISAPPKVQRGEDLVFRVEAKDGGGQAVPGVSYLYSIDWPGLRGMHHNAVSGEDEKIRAKGAPGAALLRIYTYDAAGVLTQIGKAEFRVE